MTDYHLENLGPERFQLLCNALIAKEHPNTQCFPVGQPDGGRDAVSYLSFGGSVVYQVKYSRMPLAEHDPRAWLRSVIADEVPKVAKLLAGGVTKYILITNVPGTAHPGGGSIDTVQQFLSKEIKVPAQCWWREDINRRLDDALDIKWAYPDVLTGPDIIRLVLEKGLREDQERRASAIRAFLTDQYESDKEVKFKQVELQNKLLDLFIDVPVEIRDLNSRRVLRYRNYLLSAVLANQSAGQRQFPNNVTIGAATLLLGTRGQKELDCVVIEGAPGQGKSTIVQYICQIHRHRILQGDIDDDRVVPEHRKNAVKLPLKVDCRDLALWLARKNPFNSDDDGSVPPAWAKSLESFLAHLVAAHSGGAEFSVSDLHAVARVSSIILVFDGLDEVADIARRGDVVDSIMKGASRLEQIALALQTIVTSRPAAFANSPGMPEERFTYLSLAAIDRQLVEQYAEKWFRARRLDGRESAALRRILREKLDQPHLRELARNPMQLAILLALVQTRGGSLPDKRTSLYDNYVDLFFSREAEKSTVVRDHRDLLIEIHRHLAWVLHSDSQTKQNSGSIATESLRQLVDKFLLDEGHGKSLLSTLFDGMVERVVMLVSRVEGTYEFEVQPLREYFAARHLYNTAPYSPTGSQKSGTLPERFDALCRDFYWQNVTRFYAGCYSKGELVSLVDRLEELSRAPGYKETYHPQALAATLLGDWVFSQSPKAMRAVISLVVSNRGIRQFAGTRGSRREEVLVLPDKCGGEELVEACFSLLSRFPQVDYCWPLFEIIKANAPKERIRERWIQSIPEGSSGNRTQWISYGVMLGAVSQLQRGELNSLLDADVDERLVLFHRAGHREWIELDEDRLSRVIRRKLDEGAEEFFRKSSGIVDGTMFVLSPFRYALALSNRVPLPLKDVWTRYHAWAELPSMYEPTESATASSRKYGELIDYCKGLWERTANEWASQIAPWNDLVSAAEAKLGISWTLQLLAVASAGIRARNEGCDDSPALLDASRPLCRRTRYARLRAAVPSWWEAQLASAQEEDDVVFVLLVFLVWGGKSTVSKLFGSIAKRLEGLSNRLFMKLASGVDLLHGLVGSRNQYDLSVVGFEGEISLRTFVVLSGRMHEEERIQCFWMFFRGYEGDDETLLCFCQRYALSAALSDAKRWDECLKVIAMTYAKGAVADGHWAHNFRNRVAEVMPLDVGRTIMANPDAYPTELLFLAEKSCRAAIAERVEAVGYVAEREKWFVD
ncbi:MAG: hypothetical protein AMXMBFR59_26220 [Rhodanobacteraceae bacterium]